MLSGIEGQIALVLLIAIVIRSDFYRATPPPSKKKQHRLLLERFILHDNAHTTPHDPSWVDIDESLTILLPYMQYSIRFAFIVPRYEDVR